MENWGTRFFGTEAEARQECIEMKAALSEILGKLGDGTSLEASDFLEAA